MFRSYSHFSDTVAFIRSPLPDSEIREAVRLTKFLFAMSIALALAVLL